MFMSGMSRRGWKKNRQDVRTDINFFSDYIIIIYYMGKGTTSQHCHTRAVL